MGAQTDSSSQVVVTAVNRMTGVGANPPHGQSQALYLVTLLLWGEKQIWFVILILAA